MQSEQYNGIGATYKRENDGTRRRATLVYSPSTDTLMVWTGKMRIYKSEKQYLMETIYQHTFWMHEQWATKFEVIGEL